MDAHFLNHLRHRYKHIATHKVVYDSLKKMVCRKITARGLFFSLLTANSLLFLRISSVNGEGRFLLMF